ncbi:hypothetical protein BDW66DRAFT_131709 [Aspergillus desertorum]
MQAEKREAVLCWILKNALPDEMDAFRLPRYHYFTTISSYSIFPPLQLPINIDLPSLAPLLHEHLRPRRCYSRRRLLAHGRSPVQARCTSCTIYHIQLPGNQPCIFDRRPQPLEDLVLRGDA